MVLKIDTSSSNLIKVELYKSKLLIDSLSEINRYGSQVLLELISKLLTQNNLKFNNLEQIEVYPGPGSFTGLRVGAAVGLGLGFGLKIPVNGKMDQTIDLKYQ